MRVNGKSAAAARARFLEAFLSKKVPSWLDSTAKAYWHQHKGHVKLAPGQEESFAILCQTYSDYRNATDSRDRGKYLDHWRQLAKSFGLLPDKGTTKDVSASTGDDLGAFLAEGHKILSGYENPK